ncbi:syntaxin-122 [Glycine max]|nr:syntaxin-122 [Glycine max]|eukprot:XP_006605185.1 syntaxin-122 [Glycine max]
MCEQYLGVRPNANALADGNTLKLSWLASQFANIQDYVGDEEHLKMFARAWILRFIGGVLLVDKTAQKALTKLDCGQMSSLLNSSIETIEGSNLSSIASITRSPRSHPNSIPSAMSFQDIQIGPNPSSRRNQSPSQAVATGIFQIKTAIAAFRRLVDGVGTVRHSRTPSEAVPTSSGSGEESVGIDVESQPFIREQKRQEILLLDNEISFNEAMIEEREQGIREVEEQIEQANEIFKDLAVLVHYQGVVIDDIHSNIDASAGATTQARVQLAKASKSVKSKTSWCWWVLAIFVVVLVILLVVLIL